MDFFGYAAGTPWGILEWVVFILFVITTLEMVFIVPSVISKTWRQIIFGKRHKKHKNIEEKGEEDQE